MRDEFDALVESAVKGYAAAEPTPELAAKILQHAQSERLPRRKGWKLALAFALPLAAGAVLAVVLVEQPSSPQAPTPLAVVPAAPNVAQTAKVLEPEPVRARRRVAVAQGPAKSAARPLPAPYTKQELALVAFVEQHPKEAAAFAKVESQPLKPIPEQPLTISHLEVAPLTIASLDQEK